MFIGTLEAAAGAVIVAAGFQMRKYRAYWLVMSVSVLVMLPWYPFFVCGLPVGIWAVMTLRRPEVKAAFGAAPASRP